MGLSDDQRAMLRMVAQRGEQGYEDIAALMGISVDEVRSRVAAALAELDAEGALRAESEEAAAEAPPSAAPAAPATDSAAGASEPAASPAEPQEPAAAEGSPEPAAAEGSREPTAAKAAAEPASAESAEFEPARARRPSAGAGRVKLPSGPGMRAAIGAAVAIIALVAVILIVTGGGDGESSPASAADTTTASETSGAKAAGGGEGKKGNRTNELTKARLTAVDGGDGEGVAIFGRVKKKLALEFATKGLEPTAKGEAYTIWLSKNRQKMLPLASTAAPKGQIAAKFEIPVEVLAYLADETFTDLVLTRTDTAQLTASLKTAAKQKTTPDYTGTEVLRGEVTGPIVGAQFRLEELEKEEKEEKGK